MGGFSISSKIDQLKILSVASQPQSLTLLNENQPFNFLSFFNLKLLKLGFSFKERFNQIIDSVELR